MDTLDRAILTHLQADGRMTNADLAAAIGLSPTPTLRRVRRLEADGVISGYHAHVSADAVGRAFRVLVRVDLEQSTAEALQAFEAAIADVDAIVEAHRVFGELDYVLLVAVRDVLAYEQLYTTVIAALPGVRRAVSQMLMKTVKGGALLPLPR
jgi:DNA-binding Lrp family transcriptional regulator